MAEPAFDIRGQALDWVVRVNDPDFADWATFQAWLDADAAHVAAYDVLATRSEDRIDQLKAYADLKPFAAPHPDQAIIRFFPGVGRHPLTTLLAIAASIVVVIGAYGLIKRSAGGRLIETARGEHRVLELADHTRIDLNGGTRITIDGRNDRSITLDRGEVAFRVTHDPAHPFVVAVGGATVRDLGTLFNIVREADTTTLAVAEGSVSYDQAGATVPLTRGEMLVVTGNGTRQRTTVDPLIVGAWARGRLVYDDTPLAQVAADLTRSLGRPVTVSAALAGRTFTGAITVKDPAQRRRADIAGLLDVSIAERDGRWIMVPAQP